MATSDQHSPSKLADLAEQGALALRRQVKDLFALLELPSTWRGCGPDAIAHGLLDMLVQLLRLDVALVRIDDPDGLLEHRFPADLDSNAVLAAAGTAAESEPVPFALSRPNPLGHTTVRTVSVFPSGENGRVVVGSWRLNFPTSHERRVLQTVVTQAALAMQASREALGQRRLAEERYRLERAHAALATLHARTAFLAEASATLASSLDYVSALRRVAQLAVPRLADWMVINIDEGWPIVVHRDPARADLARDSARKLTSICGEAGLVVRRGMAVAPIAARGRKLGAIVAGTEGEDTTFSAETLSLLEEVGVRAGVAVDNARLYREARQADRRKDEFLAVLGHELRNPLAPIVTACSLMRLKKPEVFERERMIIERQVNHLTRLVDDLLDVSRITRGKIQLNRELVDMSGVLAQALEMAGPLLEERRHHVQIVPPPEPLSIEADPARLAQVVANLLTNAAKYTDPGGHIRVELAREGGTAVLRVRDSGMGIPPEILPRVFEAFVQEDRSMDRARGGLGLGLTIVQSLVEMHGGTVAAESEGPGRGSTFIVRLPVAANRSSDAFPESAQAAMSQEANAEPLRVLVVDDNRDAADTVADAMQLHGYLTRLAYDGPSGLARAAEFLPHVAILDVGLPAMDGYELAARFRTDPALRMTRLIAVTGYGQEPDRQRALDSGFDAHLVKPVRVEQLLGAVKDLTRAAPSDAPPVRAA